MMNRDTAVIGILTGSYLHAALQALKQRVPVHGYRSYLDCAATALTDPISELAEITESDRGEPGDETLLLRMRTAQSAICNMQKDPDLKSITLVKWMAENVY
jgi:hypothetical protein